MTDLKARLDGFLGQSIAQICPNKFHDLSQNHCAHFASHAVGMPFSFNCKDFKGGTAEPGNIRVHEVFAQCPKVGRFGDADLTRSQLVFITRKSHVDLDAGTMVNHPQKHIGIYCDGHVYHYSNTPDEVVKWTPEKFESTFQAIYAGDQGLFFGLFPNENLELTIDTSGQQVSAGLAFELERDNGTWFATAQSGPDQQRFLVGKEFSKDTYHGLFIPVSQYYGPQFRAEDHRSRIDHWAELLETTGHCETKNRMNLINTYDRAKFTFGFYQLAAHTPGDNLILLFRRMVGLDRAGDYFPDLRLHNGRLHRIGSDGALSDLETEMNTGPNGARQLQLFMNYLNPNRFQFDTQEVLQCARVMHWTANDPVLRALQVDVAVEILQHKISEVYHRRYGMDGMSDVLCTIIADIHHQGRASRKTVTQALASNDPREALLHVNHSQWKTRNTTLKAKIETLEAEGRLGTKRYDAGLNEFV